MPASRSAAGIFHAPRGGGGVPHGEFLTGPDGEQLVPRAQPAALKGVKPPTVDPRVPADYPAPIPGCPPRRRLFRLDDVDRAETLAYEAAVRTSGSAKRVTRALPPVPCPAAGPTGA